MEDNLTLYNNFRYLLNISGMKLNIVADRIGVAESTIWHWGKGKIPYKTTLRRIARYFSETLSIPYELFQDGQALLEKDFEKVLTEARVLPTNKTSPIPPLQSFLSVGEKHPDIKISDHEKNFLMQIRRLSHQRSDIEASENALNEIVELLTLIGPGSDTHHSLVRTIRNLRQYHADMGRRPRDPEKDQKDIEGK